MEAQAAAAQQAPSAVPSSADAYPRWVLLEQDCNNIHISADADDAKTLAAARTSTGLPIHVSLRLAEPPAASRVRVEVLGGSEQYTLLAVAAHGDSVLIRVQTMRRGYQCYEADCFVYRAGAAAAADPPRPPSLSLLPPYLLLAKSRPQWGATNGTGLVRRGEDGLVVADLWTWTVPPPPPVTTYYMEDGDAPPELKVAQLYLFRSGKWGVIESPPITSYNGDDDASESWEPPKEWNTVVPVGDRLLCWVDLSGGALLICDVFEDIPRLQHLRLPVDLCLGPPTNRNVCVTAGGGALKFVNVFPRCCCGGAGACGCERSLHAYTIHTWTLRMDGGSGGMEWVMDGMVDCTEIWALDAYKGLPRVPLDRPVVSMDEPHVICFQLCEGHHDKSGSDELAELWILMVDTRTKTIRSVSRQRLEFSFYLGHDVIASNVSYFFNSDGAQQLLKDVERPPAVVADDEQPIRDGDDAGNNLTTLQSCSFAEPSSSEHASSEFIEAFLDISRYGLDDDELKAAYRILSADNGRQIRSLLGLPKKMRKGWLLMEIRTS